MRSKTPARLGMCWRLTSKMALSAFWPRVPLIQTAQPQCQQGLTLEHTSSNVRHLEPVLGFHWTHTAGAEVLSLTVHSFNKKKFVWLYLIITSQQGCGEHRVTENPDLLPHRTQREPRYPMQRFRLHCFQPQLQRTVPGFCRWSCQFVVTRLQHGAGGHSTITEDTDLSAFLFCLSLLWPMHTTPKCHRVQNSIWWRFPNPHFIYCT